MLNGKTAIVTGSTSGIGLGIAQALANHGANILLNGFGDTAQIQRQCEAFAAKFNVKVAFSGADMSRPEQVRDMVSVATREFGRVDILVNNAGIQHTSPVDDFPEDRWDAVLAINLSSNFHAIKAGCRRCDRATGAASSTSPRCMASSRPPPRRLTSPPSTAYSP